MRKNFEDAGQEFAQPDIRSFAAFLDEQAALQERRKERPLQPDAASDTPDILYGHIVNLDNPADRKIFDEVYRLFARTFREDGKPEVSKEQFEENLNFNTNAQMQKDWGPFSYTITYAYDRDSGEVLGATMHTVIMPSAHVAQADNVDVMQSGNFIFVKPEARSYGLGKHLFQQREAFAHAFAQQHKENTLQNPLNLIIFAEHLNPVALTVDQYLQDCWNARLDPCDRIIHWQKTGFRRLPIDVGYTLISSKASPADKTMTLNVIDKRSGKKAGAERPVATATILGFMQKYFAICRTDGADPFADSDMQAQVTWLQQRDAVTPVNVTEEAKALQKRIHAALLDMDTPPKNYASVRDMKIVDLIAAHSGAQLQVISVRGHGQKAASAAANWTPASAHP